VSDDSFDEIDRALAHGLSALAPEVDGGDETLDALRPRFRRARTRRRAAGIGVSLVALVAIGSVALLAAPDSERSHVQVSGSPSTRGHSSTTRSSASVSTTTRPGSTPPPSSPTTSGHSSGPSGASNPLNPSGGPSPSPGTVPGTVPNGDRGGPGLSGGGDNSGGGSGPQSTTVPPTSEVQTYRSAGGTVTVRFAHGQLQLLGESAATGYQATIGSDQPDDIDVRFDGAQGRWRIRVRVDHDGHLTHEVTQG
jgi:cytoskeletal protein RodZ